MMTTNQEKQQVSVGRSPPLVYITLRLLAQRLNGSQLSQITQLNLSGRTLPRGKIKYVEKLKDATNLKELDLSGNIIETIKKEEVMTMSKLEVLDLSRNQIHSLGGILALSSLRVLDLELNRLTEISEGIKSLKQLKELRLARNDLANLSDLKHLAPLASLSILTLHGNPFCHGHYLEYTIFELPGVDIIDGERITSEQRQDAAKRFSRHEKILLEQTLAKTQFRSTELEDTLGNLSSLLNDKSNDLERALEDLQKARAEIMQAKSRENQHISLLQSKDAELSALTSHLFDLQTSHALIDSSSINLKRSSDSLQEILPEAQQEEHTQQRTEQYDSKKIEKDDTSPTSELNSHALPSHKVLSNNEEAQSMKKQHNFDKISEYPHSKQVQSLQDQSKLNSNDENQDNASNQHSKNSNDTLEFLLNATAEHSIPVDTPLTSTEQQIEALQAHCKLLRDKLAKLHQRRNGLETRLFKTQAKSPPSDTTTSKTGQSSSNSKTQPLHRQLQALLSKQLRYSEEHDAVSTQVQEKDLRVKDIHNQLTRKQQQLLTAASHSKIEEISLGISTMRNNLENEEKALSELQKKRDDLRRDLASIGREISRVEQEILDTSSISTPITTSSGDDSNSSVDSVTAAQDAADMQQLEQEYRVVQQEIDVLETELQQITTRSPSPQASNPPSRRRTLACIEESMLSPAKNQPQAISEKSSPQLSIRPFNIYSERIKNLEQTVAEIRQSNEWYRSQLHEKEVQMQKLEETIAKLSTQQNDSGVNVSNLRQDVESKQHQIDQLNDEKAKLIKVHEQLKEKFSNSLLEMNEKLKVAQNAHVQEAQSHERAMEEFTTKHESELQRLRSLMNDAQGTFQSHTSQIKQLKEQLSAAQQRCDTLTNDRHKDHACLHKAESKYRQLLREIGHAVGRLSTLLGAVSTQSSLEQQNEEEQFPHNDEGAALQLQQLISTTEQLVTELRHKASFSNKMLQSPNNEELSEYKQQLQRATKRGDAIDIERQELQRELRNIREQYRLSKFQADLVNQEKLSLQQSYDQLKEKLSSCEADLQAASSKVDFSTFQETERELQLIKTECQKLREQNGKLQVSENHLKLQLDALQHQQQRTTQSIEEGNFLQIEFHKLIHGIFKLTGDLGSGMEALNNNLEHMHILEDCDSVSKGQWDKIGRLKSEQVNALKQLSEYLSESFNDQKEFGVLQSTNMQQIETALFASVKWCVEFSAVLTKRIAVIPHRLSDAEHQTKTASEKIKKYIEDLHSVQAELVDANSRTDQLQRQLDDTQHKLFLQEKKCSEMVNELKSTKAQENEKNQTTLNNEVEVKTRQLRRQIQSLTEKLQQATDERASCMTLYQHIKEAYERSQGTVNAKQKQINRLQQRLEMAIEDKEKKEFQLQELRMFHQIHSQQQEVTAQRTEFAIWNTKQDAWTQTMQFMENLSSDSRRSMQGGGISSSVGITTSTTTGTKTTSMEESSVISDSSNIDKVRSSNRHHKGETNQQYTAIFLPENSKSSHLHEQQRQLNSCIQQLLTEKNQLETSLESCRAHLTKQHKRLQIIDCMVSQHQASHMRLIRSRERLAARCEKVSHCVRVLQQTSHALASIQSISIENKKEYKESDLTTVSSRRHDVADELQKQASLLRDLQKDVGKELLTMCEELQSMHAVVVEAATVYGKKSDKLPDQRNPKRAHIVRQVLSDRTNVDEIGSRGKYRGSSSKKSSDRRYMKHIQALIEENVSLREHLQIMILSESNI